MIAVPLSVPRSESITANVVSVVRTVSMVMITGALSSNGRKAIVDRDRRRIDGEGQLHAIADARSARCTILHAHVERIAVDVPLMRRYQRAVRMQNSSEPKDPLPSTSASRH